MAGKRVILISGASGLIGQALGATLVEQGHRVLALERQEGREPYWNIEKGLVSLGTNKEIDVVIHLAGENVAQGCWTAKKKKRIQQSRVEGTRLLAEFFAGATYKPGLMVSASAVGFYGDRRGEKLDEQSRKGTGFLADVAQAWEAAAQPAREAGIRVVHPRFGMVLSPKGGALAKILPLFKLGLGGPLGTGRQYMSWISIHDVVQAILHIMEHEELEGAVNLVAPHPVTNRQFTKVLGRIVHRPVFLPVPRFFLLLFLGEMAKELLFASTRVYPRRLQESGYVFAEPDLTTALQTLLALGRDS
jgi:uncharacterized protein (TIGR01777 family)